MALARRRAVIHAQRAQVASKLARSARALADPLQKPRHILSVFGQGMAAFLVFPSRSILRYAVCRLRGG
jgi:hypothetical protein